MRKLLTFIVGLGAVLAFVPHTHAQETTSVQVMVMGIQRGSEADIDDRLVQEKRIIASLANAGFRKVSLRNVVNAKLAKGQKTAVPIQRKSGARTTLTIEVLGTTSEGGTHLSLQCPGIGDLQLETVHKGRAPLLVVAAREELAVAIRPRR
ncbi:MAG: hypothetical protein ACFB9M_06135 [Myxococcota bacterium]